MPFHILLADDSDADAKITTRAIQKRDIPIDVSRVRDGHEALDFVYARGQYTQARRPDLVLLDLNMPRLNGYEVLVAMKSDESLKTIPVVMLTTSDSPDDVRKTYRQHANAYLVKPIDLIQLRKMVDALAMFWVSSAQLP